MDGMMGAIIVAVLMFFFGGTALAPLFEQIQQILAGG